MKNKELYAFWRYDVDPYILGAKIEEFLDDGTVVPVGYQGAKVRPVVILPGEAGKNALEKIKELHTDFAHNAKKQREDLLRDVLDAISLPVELYSAR